MIILALCCLVFLLICCFLRIDVARAVKAKETWRTLALKTDIDRHCLSVRVDRLHDIIKDNNEHYQELSDKLEDSEFELENIKLQLAFSGEVRDAQEEAITFWIRQFNQAVDEKREATYRIAVLENRCRNIGDSLGVSREAGDKPFVLSDAVSELKTERDTLKALNEGLKTLNEGLVTDLFTCSARATKAEADWMETCGKWARTREELTDAKIEVSVIADAIRAGCGFIDHADDVSMFVGKMWTKALTADASLIVRALDQLKSDLRRQTEHLNDREIALEDAEKLRTDLYGQISAANTELFHFRGLVETIVEGIRTRKQDAGSCQVREFVLNKGFVLTTLATPDMDLIVQQLDDLFIMPTSGEAEDIAPPAKRTTQKRSNKLRAAEIAKSVKRNHSRIGRAKV